MVYGDLRANGSLTGTFVHSPPGRISSRPLPRPARVRSTLRPPSCSTKHESSSRAPLQYRSSLSSAGLVRSVSIIVASGSPGVQAQEVRGAAPAGAHLAGLLLRLHVVLQPADVDFLDAPLLLVRLEPGAP